MIRFHYYHRNSFREKEFKREIMKCIEGGRAGRLSPFRLSPTRPIRSKWTHVACQKLYFGPGLGFSLVSPRPTHHCVVLPPLPSSTLAYPVTPLPSSTLLYCPFFHGPLDGCGTLPVEAMGLGSPPRKRVAEWAARNWVAFDRLDPIPLTARPCSFYVGLASAGTIIRCRPFIVVFR